MLDYSKEMEKTQENLLKLLAAQLGLDFEKSEKPDVGYGHILFVSDKTLNKNLEDHIKRYGRLDTHDRDLFQNRTLADLIDRGIEHLWFDNNNQYARDWITLNLSDNKEFKVICVHNGSKKQKWIDDCNPHASIQYSEFVRIKSLDMKEFVKKIESLDRSVHKAAKMPFVHRNRLNKRQDK